MLKPPLPQILIAMMLVMSSCASDKNDLPQPTNAKPASPSKSQPKVPANVPTSDANEFVAPRGARFTIYAGVVSGDLHVQRAKNVRDTLKTSTDMKDWYVIHKPDKTLLYYGYYPNLDDAKAKLDREKIDLMRDQMGNRPFQQALIVEINSPDPSAPPEWDLNNAKGFWTLQIAAYKGTPERKQLAVDTVRAARQDGIEAYYFHGETASLVCVGTWPKTAVETPDDVQEKEQALRRRGRSSGINPSQPVMVVPATDDPQINRQYEEQAARGNLRLVRVQTKILDPTLDAMIQRFPRNAVNGMEMKRTVNGQDVYEHSVLYKVPQAIAGNTAVRGRSNQADPTGIYRPEIPRAFDPTPIGGGSGGGGLRGIGG